MHKKDLGAGKELAGQLLKSTKSGSIKVEVNEMCSPTKSLDDFVKDINEYQNLVIIFGEIPPIRFLERVVTVREIRKKSQGKRKASNIWVYELPTSPGKQAIGDVWKNWADVRFLDNSQVDLLVEPYRKGNNE